MRQAHTAAQVRAAEAALMAQLPEGALMQRAAAGLAVACARRLDAVYAARVALLVGAGNNGADALWAGMRLAARGAHVVAVTAGEPVADALAAFRAAGGRLGDATALEAADLVVDGLVGIGGSGPLRPAAAALAEAVRGRRVVAVDVPSGVDADTGAVQGVAVRAEATVTFGTLKPGLLVGAGRVHAGEVELVDIGLGPHLPPATVEALEAADVAGLLPVAGAGSDKYTRGVVGVAAGSPEYTGAAVLAVGAAVRAGPAWCASPAPATRRSRCACAGRRRWSTSARTTSSRPAGCRRGSSAPASAPTTGPRPSSRRCSARTSPCSSTPTR
jgi:hydroxyethylthiazole kinase-like uncharacterized protein yjeF